MADVVVIDADPSLAFYDVTRPDVDLAWPRLIDISEIASALRVNGGETPSARVRLDNGDGALTMLLSTPPLRMPASILRDGVELFSGIVQGVELGAVVVLELES